MQQEFKADLEEFFWRLQNEENFAFARYGDGELAIIKGLAIGDNTQACQVDGWSYEGGTDHPLSKLLHKSLEHTELNYYYGLPCQCCNDAAKQEYLDLVQCGAENITFANLFINGNYNAFVTLLSEYLARTQRPCILLATTKVQLPIIFHEANNGGTQSWNWIATHLLPENAVEAFRKSGEVIDAEVREIAQEHHDTIFIFVLGPLSDVLIDIAYSVNPNNVYLDVGSALDELLYGHKTRPYQHQDSHYHKNCIF